MPEQRGLVCERIVPAILRDRKTQRYVAKGILLDGFLRSDRQASALDGLLATCGEGYLDQSEQPARAAVCVTSAAARR